MFLERNTVKLEIQAQVGILSLDQSTHLIFHCALKPGGREEVITL